jgi:hypothetical protein
VHLTADLYRVGGKIATHTMHAATGKHALGIHHRRKRWRGEGIAVIIVSQLSVCE